MATQLQSPRSAFIQSMFDNVDTADVMIRVDNETFNGHICILYATSEFFCKYFTTLQRQNLQLYDLYDEYNDNSSSPYSSKSKTKVQSTGKGCFTREDFTE